MKSFNVLWIGGQDGLVKTPGLYSRCPRLDTGPSYQFRMEIFEIFISHARKEWNATLK